MITNIKKIEPQDIRIFETWTEATTAYYKTHDCMSDDSDKENTKVERWIEDMGYIVNE